ncbi:MAG: PadR family transcriptional regulator [Gemmatimonadetes bacterium]|nr:PadR family transcriptional regulator [Gemmatimonadota bacterium]
MAGSDLYVGTLDLLILKALTLAPMHGYGIGRWIRATTREVLQVQEGVLYPALHRLERRGLVAEEWGITETNREAKFYRLTAAGRRHLAAEMERWERHTAAVDAALAAKKA